jgi:hypothetical protein
MRPYRLPNSQFGQHDEIPQPKPRRGRVFVIALTTLGLHAGVLAAAFALRAPENTAPKTQIVSVLTGHVTELGDFQATGLANARIRN